VAVLGHLGVDARQNGSRPIGAHERVDDEVATDLDGRRQRPKHDHDARRLVASERREAARQLTRVRDGGREERGDGSERGLQGRAPNSVSPFFQAMRSATSAGKSDSHPRENAAFSGT
jgi:hypothetical protein